MWILHRYETLKEKVEHIRKAKIAFDIYNQYGITAKSKVIAKNKGVPEELLEVIDELYGIIMEEKSLEEPVEELLEEEVHEEREGNELIEKLRRRF